MRVAALYIDPRGPYPKIGNAHEPASQANPRIDCWDAERDARKYEGPYPIVAHPPCGPWSSNRHLYRGTEHDCGPRAVEQVRRWGGVLEHPAGSKLWEAAKLPTPRRMAPFGEAWAYDGHGTAIEVNQVEWGHVARKRTWLYLVGVPRKHIERLFEARPFPGAQPTHWVSGRRRMQHPADNVPPGIKVCSAQQRRRTPPLFAEFLIALAREARRP